MDRYEYKVLPAPRRFGRVKARGTDGKAAATLEAELNALAEDGWDYVRADTLPFDERTGLTQRTTVFHTVLVFRRPLDQPQPEDAARAALPSPRGADETENIAEPSGEAGSGRPERPSR